MRCTPKSLEASKVGDSNLLSVATKTCSPPPSPSTFLPGVANAQAPSRSCQNRKRQLRCWLLPPLAWQRHPATLKWIVVDLVELGGDENHNRPGDCDQLSTRHPSSNCKRTYDRTQRPHTSLPPPLFSVRFRSPAEQAKRRPSASLPCSFKSSNERRKERRWLRRTLPGLFLKRCLSHAQARWCRISPMDVRGKFRMCRLWMRPTRLEMPSTNSIPLARYPRWTVSFPVPNRWDPQTTSCRIDRKSKKNLPQIPLCND